ncbi:MAG TPA: hypothetical protein PKD86_08020 [Gemmatales bacterium]|nr:hypothetical protein [Gemmatales bacterium]HMP59285.1 hypothetical protein [Gemmatales bacterium]
MIRICCDLCGKELAQGESAAFVVKIEICAVKESEALLDEDLDEDHLETLSEILKHQQQDGAASPPNRESFRFELCGECRAKFAADPLNRGAAAGNLEFSQN